ncbi:MAG: hypothetical protein KA795_05965 [Burkholderiaceae bacterium]|nr:hypothetical protein [Burkholderiaceae bacterium]
MLIQDLAALTGRAQFMALRKRLREQQMKVHVEMAQVLEASRVAGSPITLVRHLPMSGGEHQGSWRLRWRIKAGGLHRHATWDDLQSALGLLPGAVRRHYVSMNRRVDELNVLDRLLQGSLNRCEGFLGLGGESDPSD